MATPSASPQVFGVPELLENVIIYLPFKDIVRNQQISRQWHKTIAGCPLIQQALCLKPKGKFVAEAFKPRYKEHMSIVIIKVKTKQSPLEFHSCLSNYNFHLNPIAINFLFVKEQSFEWKCKYPDTAQLDYMPQWTTNEFQKLSLSKMYLTQPPATQVGFVVHNWIVGRLERRIINAHGVTLGEFIAGIHGGLAHDYSQSMYMVVRDLVVPL